MRRWRAGHGPNEWLRGADHYNRVFRDHLLFVTVTQTRFFNNLLHSQLPETTAALTLTQNPCNDRTTSDIVGSTLGHAFSTPLDKVQDCW